MWPVRTAWVEACRDAGLPYVDVGELGFESALREAAPSLAGAAITSVH